MSAAQVLQTSTCSAIAMVGKYSHEASQAVCRVRIHSICAPSNPSTAFTDISGDFVCAGCAAFNNTNINNTAFSSRRQVIWRHPPIRSEFRS